MCEKTQSISMKIRNEMMMLHFSILTQYSVLSLSQKNETKDEIKGNKNGKRGSQSVPVCRCLDKRDPKDFTRVGALKSEIHFIKVVGNKINMQKPVASL